MWRGYLSEKLDLNASTNNGSRHATKSRFLAALGMTNESESVDLSCRCTIESKRRFQMLTQTMPTKMRMIPSHWLRSRRSRRKIHASKTVTAP